MFFYAYHLPKSNLLGIAYEKAYENCTWDRSSKQLTEESLTIEKRRDLSVSYNRPGNICKVEGDLQSARKYFELALEIYKELVEEMSTSEAWDNLAVSYYNLGTLDDSVDYLQKAFDIWSRFAQQYPSVPLYATNRDIVRAALKKRGK